jgi:hypothetical protein
VTRGPGGEKRIGPRLRNSGTRGNGRKKGKQKSKGKRQKYRLKFRNNDRFDRFGGLVSGLK